MFTLTTLLFCAIVAPAINAPNGNYPEIPSTVHRVKNTGQVRTKRQYWEATADRQNSKNVNREKQNEQHNNNEQISVSYIYYDGSAQNYKPPPPPPRHWGKQDYYPRPPPPPHDGRYPRRPGSPHQYEADHRRPDFSHDNRDDRPWPPPPPPDRRRSFDHGPPPPHHGPPPPDRHRSFDHGSLPPPHRDHGPPHHDRGPPPPWNRGPPRRGPPPPWYSGPPHRGPPRHGPPPPPHYSPPYFDRKPPHSTHYNEKQPFKDKRPPNDGPPPDRIPSLNENNSPSSAYNTQTGSSNDQNEDFIKNLKLVFSNEFKTTFLKNRQVISENNNEKATTINTPDPGYKQGQGEPLANLEYSTVSVHTTPPSLSHLFQVVPVTPAS